MLRSLILAATVFAGTGIAHATPVTPVTYEMLNGTTGSYQYWDATRWSASRRSPAGQGT